MFSVGFSRHIVAFHYNNMPSTAKCSFFADYKDFIPLPQSAFILEVYDMIPYCGAYNPEVPTASLFYHIHTFQNEMLGIFACLLQY
ncbi:hypothetical protein T05_13882 [Trichinella murrelli]|uniref:Uncharacterized protein n=1 Tax=Trichinella murrelli TaxID=144512 RepID=A0A0V0SXC7_9BILA|nr:hypothetical protein T05_13882 [Trichinella murrelli]